MGRRIIIALTIFSLASVANAQSGDEWIIEDYENPKEYVIGGLDALGCVATDRNLLILSTGLSFHSKITIPGNDITQATERIMKTGRYSDCEIMVTGLRSDTIFLLIQVVERPTLLKYGIRGLKKQETKNVRDEISLKQGEIITREKINRTTNEVKAYFEEKGYYNVRVDIDREKDDSTNAETLHIHVKKGKRVKVHDIIVEGNDNISDRKIRSLIEPKRKKKELFFFKTSKLVKADWNTEKKNIVRYYQSLGYRDAELTYDSIIRLSPNRVNIKLGISEGKKYYFRNISWVGNTIYTTGKLDTILGIEKGEIFNQSKLNARLYLNPAGPDVSSMYMDQGYLFFNINPMEILVEGDSIDLEIRIYEGKQATIGEVNIVGNDKTSDHVIRRAIRTIPGSKFSRSDIQRSVREINALGYFAQDKLEVVPVPNPAEGTVDITYKVVEKPSDKVEASAGFGGGFGFVGSVGVTFNNFSTRRMFEKGGWNPIPTGDGQRLTLRAQSNGVRYQAYNFSFTEPWLGGEKPNSLTISAFHSIQSNFRQRTDPDRSEFKTTGATVSFGKLLNWPDDYFTFQISAGYQRYQLNQWTAFGAEAIGYNNGISNSININPVMTRNSTSGYPYPRSGSVFSISLSATPPLSLLHPNRNYSEMSPREKFKWVEYHKWKIQGNWYIEPVEKLVIAPSFLFGAIGVYNKNIGYAPFEQFRVGGSGFGSWAYYGTEIIPTKGYKEGAISADDPNQIDQDADPIVNKYSIEMRYPLSLNPSATIYGYTYFEAANTWNHMRDFNPFALRRSVGVGVRMNLPMFGLLCFDYGLGLDNPEGPRPKFLFSIGQQF